LEFFWTLWRQKRLSVVLDIDLKYIALPPNPKAPPARGIASKASTYERTSRSASVTLRPDMSLHVHTIRERMKSLPKALKSSNTQSLKDGKQVWRKWIFKIHLWSLSWLAIRVQRNWLFRKWRTQPLWWVQNWSL